MRKSNDICYMKLKLFGPRWNPNIPRFAANLGFTPLEPIKATAEPQQSSAANTSKIQGAVCSDVS